MKLMLLKKKIEGKKSENLKAEKKINLAQIRWFPAQKIFISDPPPERLMDANLDRFYI